MHERPDISQSAHLAGELGNGSRLECSFFQEPHVRLCMAGSDCISLDGIEMDVSRIDYNTVQMLHCNEYVVLNICPYLVVLCPNGYKVHDLRIYVAHVETVLDVSSNATSIVVNVPGHCIVIPHNANSVNVLPVNVTLNDGMAALSDATLLHSTSLSRLKIPQSKLLTVNVKVGPVRCAGRIVDDMGKTVNPIAFRDVYPEFDKSYVNSEVRDVLRIDTTNSAPLNG